MVVVVILVVVLATAGISLDKRLAEHDHLFNLPLLSFVQMTLESIQLFLNDVYAYAQLMTAVIGLLAILIPILKSYSFYYDLIDFFCGLLDAALDRLLRFDLLPFFLSGTITTSYDSQESVVCVEGLNKEEESALTAGLVNTGNSCFLNSVLQVTALHND